MINYSYEVLVTDQCINWCKSKIEEYAVYKVQEGNWFLAIALICLFFLYILFTFGDYIIIQGQAKGYNIDDEKLATSGRFLALMSLLMIICFFIYNRFFL